MKTNKTNCLKGLFIPLLLTFSLVVGITSCGGDEWHPAEEQIPKPTPTPEPTPEPTPDPTTPKPSFTKLHVEGRWIVDENGVRRNLHGFAQTYSPWFNEQGTKWNNYDVSACLSGKNWEEFLRTMVPCDVDLWLPKFETKFHIDLNDILSEMGMASSFDALKADFTAMSADAMCLSFVKQDAVIKVDEEGTEAAAVSHAGMDAASAGPGEHIVFHADRPFLYLITESSTGTILFAGKYSGK